ncbi:unnamed protein product [Mytilus edulis]|uniref:Farnesoic acid O-methyl transferase domain-containing protein n=1 Tax=Mytilus edulis TaxID=6550 RepID=A0A8S3Q1H9_MYTED|nr:unnamed protein product [Mytilus edulis]
MDSYYLYKIVIDRPFNSLNDKRITSRSYIRIGEDIVETKVYYNFQKVLDCNNYKEFYITWNDNTITMGLGLQGNGTLFLKWTSSTKLESIQNVGIRTQIGIGKWIFYTSDIPTMTEEATSWPKNPIARDLLLSTDVTRYPISTSINYKSTISQGTSIRSQPYTRQIIMNNEAIGLPQTTRPNDKETTSDNSQSRKTNVDSVINNYTATSTSTVSTTITESSPISTSTVSTTIT